MFLRCRLTRLTIFTLVALSIAGSRSLPAAGGDLPQRFAAEIFPGLQSPQAQHEPVVYHFDGEQVRARWKQTTVLPSASGAGNLKQVMTTEMSGTFRNGVLKGEQVSELTHIEPPGGYGEDFSGGPVVRMFYKGVIEGRLEPDGRIKAKVTTTPTGVKALTYSGGTNGAPAVYEWIDQPPPETAPGVLEYWIPLPAAGWFNSRYLLASGAETFRLRGALERLDRYMNGKKSLSSDRKWPTC